MLCGSNLRATWQGPAPCAHAPFLPTSRSASQPNFEEDFCTFLLSDVEYGGVNAHADLEQKVAREAAAKAKKV
jgi:hypothetical protein